MARKVVSPPGVAAQAADAHPKAIRMVAITLFIKPPNFEKMRLVLIYSYRRKAPKCKSHISLAQGSRFGTGMPVEANSGRNQS